MSDDVIGSIVTTPPVVCYPQESGFQVMWGVSRLARGWVEVKVPEEDVCRIYQEDGRGYVPQGDEYIRVRVQGLPAGAVVSMRAVTEALGDAEDRHVSSWEEVRLLKRDSDHVHFAVWSDTHNVPELLHALDEKTPRSLDFLIWNGDTCPDMWHEKYAFVPTLLNPGGTHFTHGRPAFLVPGNHDFRGLWGYRFPDFSFQEPGSFHHAFRVGPAAFILLNTGEDKEDGHPTFGGRIACESVRREQAAWLREVIRKPEMADAPYRIVVCHIPLRWDPEEPPQGYDRYSERSWRLWRDSLLEWGAQLVISGHTHANRFFPPEDEYPFVQLTVGSSAINVATYLEAMIDRERCRLWVHKVADDAEGASQFYELTPVR